MVIRIFDSRRDDYCSWEGCVNHADWGSYCQHHHDVRYQQNVSHRMEGHSEEIPTCPSCEAMPYKESK
jgi:hypothetical protein